MALPTARSLLGRLVRVREEEIGLLLASGGYFFFLLASYYVLRPLREEMGLTGGGERLNWLYAGTLLGTLVLNPVFGVVVSRWPRRVFIPVVYRFLLLNLLLFYGLFRWIPDGGRPTVARAFFIWVSVFNLFAVSVFWGFMADLFRSEQGKRLFGAIGAGGTLGGIVGAGATAFLATRIGHLQLLLLASALLESAVQCVRFIARRTEGRVGGAEASQPPGTGALAGMRRVFRSSYLLAICGFLVLMAVSSTLIYFEQARIVRATFSSAAERTAFFARIDLFVNLLTVMTQTLVTGRLLGVLGVGGVLTLMPLVTLGGFVTLAAAPAASALVLVQTLRRACDYGVVRPAREVLFTVLGREAKYSSKSFIDTFVLRSGDLAGALGDTVLRAAGRGGTFTALLFAPVALVWVVASLWLGRRQAEKENRPELGRS